MKKTLFKSFVLLFLFISVLGIITTYAWDYKYVGPFPITDISVSLDGKILEFDVLPQIINGRTMVPLDDFAEAIDAEISCDEPNVSLKVPNKQNETNTRIDFAINSEKLSYSSFTKDFTEKITDDVHITLDSVPIKSENEIWIPVRAISEALGYKVEWENDIKFVHIATLHKGNYKPAYIAAPDITMGKYTCESICDNRGRRVILIYAENELSDKIFLETENGEYLFFENVDAIITEDGYKYTTEYVPFPDTYTIYCYPTKDGEVANMRTQINLDWNRE